MMVGGVSGISAVFAHKVVLGLGVGSARVADIRIALSGVSELVFDIGSWLGVRVPQVTATVVHTSSSVVSISQGGGVRHERGLCPHI